MSTPSEIAERPGIYDPPPPLENGDRLTRAEFERRYQAMPQLKKAELVEGVVYMPSPVRLRHHGQPHFDLITWLGTFKSRTPGLLTGDNSTVRLDLDNEPQPDALLLIDSALGGQATISEDDFVEGAPELVAEIAASSVSYDANVKRNAYRRNGVCEYIVWRVLDREIDWFVLRQGEYERLAKDSAGVYRSGVFPGLWLDDNAMLAGDFARVLDTVNRGLASPEHAAWVERLNP